MSYESVNKIKSLQQHIETFTGKSYGDLTAAVQELKNGYGSSDGGSGVSLLGSGTCGENATWTAYSDGRFVVSGSGAIDDVGLTASGIPITDSDECEWATYRDKITSIIIEEGITSIGRYFFVSLSEATEITLADSITSIGARAFWKCGKLPFIKFPKSLTTIGNYAFHDCRALETIIIFENLTAIGKSAFLYCNSLANIFYSGTKDQYDLISIDSNNSSLLNATLHCEYEQGVVKEEQEQTVFIDNNGTTTVLPDEGKTLSKVTVNVSVPTEGGAGIIDVTKLPAENIVENAVYRLTEGVCTKNPQVYITYTGMRFTLQEYLLGFENVSTIPNIYEVDELSNMLESDTTTYSVVNVYILRSSGVAYLNVPALGGAVSIGKIGFGNETSNKGYADGFDDMTDYFGVYSMRGDYVDAKKYYIRENGEWREITAYIIAANNLEFVSGNISERMLVAADILSGKIKEIDENWFLNKDGTYLTKIFDYKFYETNLKTATIPHFIETIYNYAFARCYDLETVTFKGKPTAINANVFEDCNNLTTINVPWGYNEVANSPWGATGATINYSYTGE